MKTSPFVMGRKGLITCDFDFNVIKNFTWSNVTFLWTKDDGFNKSFSTTTPKCRNSKCESQMEISNVDRQSEGTYSCKAILDELHFYGNGTASSPVKVWEVPKVVIEPDVAIRQKDEYITISCFITNVNTSYISAGQSLKLCFGNGSEIVGGQGSNFNQSYSFQVERSLEIICGLSNCSAATLSNITMVARIIDLNLAIEGSPFIEGNYGSITCGFELNETYAWSNVTFSWTKDGEELYNSLNALQIVQACSGSSCYSEVELLKVDFLSQGEYKCKAEISELDIHGNGSANTVLIMKEKPQLMMDPIAASIKKNEKIKILCYVRNINKTYLSSNDSLSLCYSSGDMIEGNGTKFNQSLLLQVQSSFVIHCGINNCSYGKSSEITMVKTDEILCEKKDGWPTSSVGKEVTMNCPEKYIGIQKRKCERNGNWGSIDTSKCKQEELKKVENAIQESEDISESVLQKSLSKISDVVNATDEKSEVAHLNVFQSVNILSTISTKNISFATKEAAEETTEVFAGVVSQLLNVDKTLVRQANETQEKDVKSKIISSVDGFAKRVTKSLKTNQNVTVQKKNILLTIKKGPKQEIVFPESTSNINEPMTKFKLPKDALSKLGDEVAFTAVKYDEFGSEFGFEDTKKRNITVDSSVLSLTIEDLQGQTLDSNITLTFQRKNIYVSNSSSDCVFLNLTSNTDTSSSWSAQGCSVDFTNTSLTVCTCNHLTNFAILMSLSDDVSEDSKEDYERLRMISIIGCSLSIAGAFITIIIYLYFWRYIKSRRSSLVVNLCIALCVAYLMFLTAVEHTENKIGCIVIAALLHYFFLAMFCIMLCLGIDLAVAILNVFSSRSSSAVFYVVGWGLPAVIVGITLGGAQLEGYGDDRYCWLRKSSLYGFIVPVLCIISINLIIVIIVMRMMYTSAFMVKKSLKEKTKSGLRGMCALLPILGLTWVFGILSINEDLIFFQYLFAIFNSLQGLFIFLFHVVLNNQVRQAVSKKIKQYESKTSFTRSKSSKSKIVSHSSSGDMLNSDSEEPRVSNRYTIPRLTLSAPNNNTQL